LDNTIFAILPNKDYLLGYDTTKKKTNYRETNKVNTRDEHKDYIIDISKLKHTKNIKHQ